MISLLNYLLGWPTGGKGRNKLPRTNLSTHTKSIQLQQNQKNLSKLIIDGFSVLFFSRPKKKHSIHVWLIYLPTFAVKKQNIHSGKYISHMDAIPDAQCILYLPTFTPKTTQFCRYSKIGKTPHWATGYGKGKHRSFLFQKSNVTGQFIINP